MIFKRGKVYWFDFTFRGERFRRSTRQGNLCVARQMESALRTALAKGEVGIMERKPAPKLADFAPQFTGAIETLCASKPATVSFYKEKLRRLLHYKPLSSSRLDRIDEALVGAYTQHRSKQVSRYGEMVAPASVNRELATLRRLLRLAQEWKVIDRVPRIRLLRGERSREFVLGWAQEEQYLNAAPQPLCDAAMLILDTGLRVGEARTLEWAHVHLEPAAGALFGYLQVPGGKSSYARRTLSLTGRASEMLKRRQVESQSRFVFPGKTLEAPILGTSLNHRHAEVREDLKLPKEFVLHSLRHTMLTRLGEAGADAFTIMRIAGHSSVTVSQRYVHPSPESLERAFERLDALNEKRRGGRRPRRCGRPPTKSTTIGRSKMPLASGKLNVMSNLGP